MEPFYSLNDDDLQHVAITELGRELTEPEKELIKSGCVEKINWYDAIAYTIAKHFADERIAVP